MGEHPQCWRGGLKVLELDVDLVSGLLGIGNLFRNNIMSALYVHSLVYTDSLSLEGLNRLDVRGDVVGDGLKVLQNLLRLINDGLVFEDRAVVGKVDGGGLSVELSLYPLCVRVALAEGLESSNSL